MRFFWTAFLLLLSLGQMSYAACPAVKPVRDLLYLFTDYIPDVDGPIGFVNQIPGIFIQETGVTLGAEIYTTINGVAGASFDLGEDNCVTLGKTFYGKNYPGREYSSWRQSGHDGMVYGFLLTVDIDSNFTSASQNITVQSKCLDDIPYWGGGCDFRCADMAIGINNLIRPESGLALKASCGTPKKTTPDKNNAYIQTDVLHIKAKKIN